MAVGLCFRIVLWSNYFKRYIFKIDMAQKKIGLVGMWDCVAFDEVAGITFKDKDGIQIMKDYMASGSFAIGKEEKNVKSKR